MNSNLLQSYVERGMSSYEIAKEVGKSPTTIRYWLKKHNLQTSKISFDSKICPKCNTLLPRTAFYNRRNSPGTSVYCKTCTKDKTLERQRNIKKSVVDYLGGKCQRCGYSKCLGALQIHHLHPNKKDPDYLKFKMRTFDDRFKQELSSCILLCANCHLEEHTGYC